MRGRWATEKAKKWAADLPWLVGCNFVPSTAINQIEMFATDTFDPVTIDRELGWAAAIGMNAARVYLHDLLWADDAVGLKARLDRFLDIAASKAIRTLFVFFDDCWHEPQHGVQPDPVPGLHNSGWARSPGRDILADQSLWPRLEDYVTDIARHFADDRRIIGWDIYNEVGNVFMPALSLPEDERNAAFIQLFANDSARSSSLALMEAAFEWVRATNPVQPLTVGSWSVGSSINDKLYELSDIISFHNYQSADAVTAQIAELAVHDRPLWCTEYLNRRDNCLFETHLPIFKENRVGAWNWGLVDGKTQTKFSWQDRGSVAEPTPWFHDVLRTDGQAFDEREIAFLKGMLAQ